ncbi:MAG: endonuclease/exonuclease/phosphatase family protein [Planctomycetota bacterium]
MALTAGRRLAFGRATEVVPVDIFNIHLSLTSRMRRRQVRHLLEIDELVRIDPQAACLIAGDMNDWGGVLKRRIFEPAGFRCATNRQPGSRWALKTYPSFAPTGGLDKIFYRGPLRLIRVYRSSLPLARVASDHLPVIADFELALG